MRTHRFGTKIKLPSTVAIKHQLLTMMLEDEVGATPAASLLATARAAACCHATMESRRNLFRPTKRQCRSIFKKGPEPNVRDRRGLASK